MTADLGPAATPRPIPTMEDRMRHARLNGNQADIAFGTYLDRTERDQLDARAATAEQERDDALDDLTETRAKLAIVIGERDERLTLAESSRLAKRYDEAIEARDVLRHRLDAMKAAKKRVLGRLEKAEHVIDLMRDGREQQDRALAAWDTTPAETCSPPCTLPKGHPMECDANQQPHEDPSRLREQLAEAHADCARYATERDEARRLLDQTTAALNVALHHANDNTSYSPTTDHYKQRADELDGCRIALQEATEATTPPSSVPPRRAQEPPTRTPICGDPAHRHSGPCEIYARETTP